MRKEEPLYEAIMIMTVNLQDAIDFSIACRNASELRDEVTHEVDLLFLVVRCVYEEQHPDAVRFLTYPVAIRAE